MTALPAVVRAYRHGKTSAETALDMIAQLYAIKARARDEVEGIAGPEERHIVTTSASSCPYFMPQRGGTRTTASMYGSKLVFSPAEVEQGEQLRSASVTNLEEALQQSREAARLGYGVATQALEHHQEAIRKAREELRVCRRRLEESKVRSADTIKSMDSQLDLMSNQLQGAHRESAKRLEAHRRSLAEFSVTLFGRTMAGKSTLMEILTEGEGSSIGKGAQRTTRDVRTYRWRGLQVTDVPGVAAFEGEVDEEVAFAAAEKADLVLFLITDDAPQPAEASHLARVKRLGKPVLGICNLKVATETRSQIRRFLGKRDDLFNSGRIRRLEEQFLEFVRQEVPDVRLNFIPTHLRARFLAERPGYEEHREALVKASGFQAVEKSIIGEIVGRGRIFRYRAFIDAATKPMLDLTNHLLEFSLENSRNGRLLVSKRRQIYTWLERFEERGLERIQTRISGAYDKLRAHVPSFVEDHVEDRNLSKKWKRYVEEARLDEVVEKIQQELIHEVTSELEKFSRELQAELRLSKIAMDAQGLKAANITDYQRAVRWGGSIVSGVLAIGSLFTPVGWAAVAVGIGSGILSFFFDNREKKLQKARKELEKKLMKGLAEQEKEHLKAVRGWFQVQIIDELVWNTLSGLDAYISSLFEVADTQRALSRRLNKQCRRLHRSLVEEGLRQCGVPDESENILRVARVPGVRTLVIVPEGHKPPKEARRLSVLLDEPVNPIYDTGDPKSIAAQAFGRAVRPSQISREERIQTLHVTLYRGVPDLEDRLSLVHQLTDHTILVKRGKPCDNPSRSRRRRL